MEEEDGEGGWCPLLEEWVTAAVAGEAAASAAPEAAAEGGCAPRAAAMAAVAAATAAAPVLKCADARGFFEEAVTRLPLKAEQQEENQHKKKRRENVGREDRIVLVWLLL